MTATVLARRYGRVCLVGLLDHAGPLADFNPLFQMPFGGVHLSSFASAFTYGSPDYPLTEVPLQAIVDRVAAGRAADFLEGMTLAAHSIDSGAAMAKVDQLARFTHAVAE